jgi:tctex1 domain-containing protein 2
LLFTYILWFFGSFRRKKVSKVIAECLQKELDGKEFDEDDCKLWSTSIADAVKARIRQECNFPRYKIVVQSFIGQQKLQDVRIASRCLWDNDYDNHASAAYNSVRALWGDSIRSLLQSLTREYAPLPLQQHIWATCIVFGFYAD